MNAAFVKGDPCYAQLKEYLIQCTGLAYYRDRDDELARRIGGRLESAGVDGYGPYLALLRVQPSGQVELDLLISDLTIGETYFFRHPQQFEVLRSRILPDILERNRASRTLKIWSAGCASGAEAYSLSILIRDEFAGLAGWDVLIVGTDVNRQSLAQARLGSYEDWALRGMDQETRGRLFRHDGGKWVIRDRYRQGMAFQYHNLVRDAVPSMLNNLFAFDLILCRNVMIYFDRATAAAVVERLRECVAERGWLLAGPADIDPQAFNAFEIVQERDCTAYRRTGSALAAPAPPVGPAWEPIPESGLPPANPRQSEISHFRAPGGSGVPPCDAPVKSAVDDVRALADKGDWAAAASRCASLLEAAPLDPVPHFYHALVQEQMGRLVEAEKSLRRSIYLDRRFVLGHYHLALLLQRDPRAPGAARRSFANVLALLESIDNEFRFAHGDGITAAGLRELTKMHLEVLRI